jgi:hypothetical protein
MLDRVKMLFRRAPSPQPAESTPLEVDPDRGHTAKKGKPTPSRREAEKQRRAALLGPRNSREAKAQRRSERVRAYEGMREGDEKYMLARDRGPARKLVRDIVDSRRNVGTFFFLGALFVVIGSMEFWPTAVKLIANALWLSLISAMFLDAFLISRRIKKMIRERLPQTTDRLPALYFYGVMRSVVFRRMRTPVPRVNLGDPI